MEPTAELNNFYIKPRFSLNLVDARFKLAALVCIGSAALRQSLLGYTVLSILVMGLLAFSELPVRKMGRMLLYFGVFLLVVFITRAFLSPDPPDRMIGFIPVSKKSILDALMFCWRFAIVIILSIWLSLTVQASSVRLAVIWYLKPFSFIPRQKIGTMISLMLRFIPMILTRYEHIDAAMQSRLANRNPNRLKRLYRTLRLLLTGTFQDANRLVWAMESRCYAEDRSERPLRAVRLDWKFIGIIALFSLISFLL